MQKESLLEKQESEAKEVQSYMSLVVEANDKINNAMKINDRKGLREMALLAQIFRTFSERRVQVGFKTLPDDLPLLCRNKHSAHNDDYIVATLDHVTISFLKQLVVVQEEECTNCPSRLTEWYRTTKNSLLLSNDIGTWSAVTRHLVLDYKNVWLRRTDLDGLNLKVAVQQGLADCTPAYSRIQENMCFKVIAVLPIGTQCRRLIKQTCARPLIS
uniref:Uncharacterized protein n=1 Tax=Timema cristinae TaxID=61476 RepID=A0A7R9GVL9_TIMCR|nr:unnamed protein product [Timema cristinae]